MSFKVELETWGAALRAYDEEDYPQSIQLFDRIADTSKILCNIGLIYATMGEHELAVANFAAACSLDTHLAIGYFQTGVSNFLLKEYGKAYKDFEEALVHLRSNEYIDYDQLGLKFKLWRPEIVFNKGLCQIYMGNTEFGMRDLEAAYKDKTLDDHKVISEAIAEKGKGYTVFSIPVGVLYRPSESKLKNVKEMNFIGQAKLIAASESKDAFTEFTGVKRLQDGLGPAGQRLDRPLGADPSLPASQAPTFRSAAPIYDVRSTPRNDSPALITRIERDASFPPPPPPPKGPVPVPVPVTAPQPIAVAKATTVTFASSVDKGRPQATPSEPEGSKPRFASADEGTSNLNGRGPPPSSFRPQMSGIPVRARTTSTKSDTDRPRPTDGRRPSGQTSVEPQQKLDQQASSLKTGRPTPSRSATVDDTTRQPRAASQARARSRSRDPQAAARNTPPAVLRRQDTNLSKPRGGVTQFYDEYFDVYGPNEAQKDAEPQLERGGSAARRVAVWNNKTVFGAPPDLPPSRAPSQAVRRKTSLQVGPTRQAVDVGSNGSASQYGDEEKSGSVVDPPWKIRVKIHHDDDTRGMAVSSDTSFDDFKDLVVLKFGIRWSDLTLKFKDDDDGKISLRDSMDWEMAIEVARGKGDGAGKPKGKLEMWLMVS